MKWTIEKLFTSAKRGFVKFNQMILKVLAVVEKVLARDVEYNAGPKDLVDHLFAIRAYRRKIASGQTVTIGPELEKSLKIAVDHLNKEIPFANERQEMVINTCVEHLKKLLGKA